MDQFDWLMRELLLFAGCGFLLIGTDDLLVDFVWFAHLLKRATRRDQPVLPGSRVEQPTGPVAVFVAAWQEEAVIGAMIRRATSAWEGQNYLLFVGCYPNDHPTLEAVAGAIHPAVRRVINPLAGPTTKGDCLNVLWAALHQEEVASGKRFRAVVLHDAEDFADPDEIALYHRELDRFDIVQIPVIPLVDPASRWVSGHYIDEFGEAHARDMVVRHFIGASLPMAGVGCAISRPAMDHVAGMSGGKPFDADSMTEDYELGLRLGALGYSSTFVRQRSPTDGRLIGVRAFFPSTLSTAIRQKTRWSVGIALLGWKRLGWHWTFQDMWMRLRDRRTILAAIILAAAYCSMALLLVRSFSQIWLDWPAMTWDGTLALLYLINTALLFWRIIIRALCVWRGYGVREALRSIPRMLVSSFIAIAAARRAVWRYVGFLRTAHISWDKTEHVFPTDTPP